MSCIQSLSDALYMIHQVEFVTDDEVLRILVLGLFAEERYEDRSLDPQKLYLKLPVCRFFELAVPPQRYGRALSS